MHSFYFTHAAFLTWFHHDLFFSSLISLTQFHVFCFSSLFLSPFSAALSHILFCDFLRFLTKLYKVQRLQGFSFALRSRSITFFLILTTFLSLIYYHVTQKNFRQRDSIRHTSGCLITSFNDSGKPFLITKIIPFILFFHFMRPHRILFSSRWNTNRITGFYTLETTFKLYNAAQIVQFYV